LVTALLGARALAASSRVALVESGTEDELVHEALTRVRAELLAAGFDVQVLEGASDATPRDRVEAAKLDPPPVATLSLLRTGEGAAADVWVSDRLTGKTLVRRVDVNDVSRARAPTVLAVRTVELLRASLLEATEEPEATKATPETPRRRPVPKDVVRWMTPKPTPIPPSAFVRAEIGAALLVGFPGSPPAYAPVIRLGYGGESWSVRLGIVAPAVGAEVKAAAGSASVRQDLVELELVAAWPARGPWAFVASLGGGASHFHVQGSALPPWLVHQGDDWTFATDAGVGGLLRLGSRVGLLADFHAILLAPNVAVQIGDVQETVRRPMELATLGVWGTF
jgi:hypothetical protein